MYSFFRLGVVGGVILHFVLSDFSSYAIASDVQYNRASLRGLKGVYVSVEGLSPEIQKDGLTEDLIRRDVESKLRMAEIRPLSKQERFDVMGSPHLSVNVNALILRDTREYVYSIQVTFRQNVYPEREPILVLGATTWSVGGIIGITHSLDKIRASVKGQVDEFIRAYLSVNPKR